jgi:hypothetical protein
VWLVHLKNYILILCRLVATALDSVVLDFSPQKIFLPIVVVEKMTGESIKGL